MQEWWRLILPAILLLLYAFTISEYLNLGAFFDRNFCNAMKAMDFIFRQNQNDTAIIDNETILIKSTGQLITANVTKPWEDSILEFEGLAQSEKFVISQRVGAWLNIIDPFFPYPCEIILFKADGREQCVFYENEETFDCFRDIVKNFGVPYPDYRPADAMAIASNALYLCLVGFLVPHLLVAIVKRWLLAYGRVKGRAK